MTNPTNHAPAFASAGSAIEALTELLTDPDVRPAELRAAAIMAERTPVGGHAIAERLRRRCIAAGAFALELEEAGDTDEADELEAILNRRELLDDRIAGEEVRARIMLEAIRLLDPAHAGDLDRLEAAIAEDAGR